MATRLKSARPRCVLWPSARPISTGTPAKQKKGLTTMMWRLPEPRFDVACALDRGGRDYQEDSLVSDFAVGDDCGIVVLADGMGGHSAGDVASKTVVTEVYS